MTLPNVPTYLHDAAVLSNPHKLNLSDDKFLLQQLHECGSHLASWEADQSFWQQLSVEHFGEIESETLYHATEGEPLLVKMILGVIANPEHRAGRAWKCVGLMSELLHKYHHVVGPDGVKKDPGTPVKLLGDAFKAASGGLVISGAFVSENYPLAIRAGALATGTTAIIEAQASMKKNLAGMNATSLY